jgi:uncharacterized protein (DUF4415 family)
LLPVAENTRLAVPIDGDRRGTKRDRSPADHPKAHVNIGLDADVVASFRASGRGWHTRLNAALKEWLKTHSAA